MSAVAVPPLIGAQTPRVLWVPDGAVSSAGQEAVELAAMAGLHLDPWQQLVLEHGLAERADGRWLAFEVGLVVSRQNGKDGDLEGRALAGLFLLGEQLLIHSAHEFPTAMESMRRLVDLIDGCDDLRRRVDRVKWAHGEEGIYLKNGQRIRFRTRTKGGGRGFSCDCLLLNEAMILPEAVHGTLLPTMAARDNAQVWYTGTAVDQLIHEHGVVLASVRERGLAGDDPDLIYMEWSPDVTIHEAASVVDDEQAWVQANPAMGIRISREHIARERRSMSMRNFAVERLSIGDWPETELDDKGEDVLDHEAWGLLGDENSKAVGKLCLTVDVNRARTWASIGAAGYREDGLPHLELIDRRAGTSWVVDRVVELTEKHEHIGEVVIHESGPAGSLIKELNDRGVKVRSPTEREFAQACGRLVDLVTDSAFRHRSKAEFHQVLDAAVGGVKRRSIGDSWAWSRSRSAVDVAPLIAVTLALWGLTTGRRRGPVALVI